VVANLARAEDVESVAAVVEHDRVVHQAQDAWRLLGEWAAGVTAEDAAARLCLLGVPGGEVPDAHEWWRDSVMPVGVAGSPVARADIADGPVPDASPLVVDLSSLWAGPLCAKLLGDAGARVVKVEVVGRPDGARRGNAAFYAYLHGGHESVLIDLRNHEDRDLLNGLIHRADIVVESSRPRALLSWGIDAYEVCRQRPTTWVSITAYGRRFPERVGFGDDVAMAAGLAAREPGEGWPLPCGDAIADPLTGMHAAVHALASYRLGRSCVLDVAMAEVVAGTVAWCAT
jgi:crotonobetainyl-CoA:carnitine CoA-transferase CaiB-like acyl-CoA transferase